MSLSTVSATIQDPSGQAFANGTWQLVFKPAPNTPGLFTDGGVTFTTIFRGSLDGTGSFSQAVARNDTIAPAGSKWTLTVTPNANGQAFSVDLNVNSGAFNASTAINAVVTNIIVQALPITHAYKDSEVIPIPGSGGLYYDVTLKVLKVWDAATSVWISITSAVIPTGTGFTHITGGVQDAAAKIVGSSDLATSLGLVTPDIGVATGTSLTTTGSLTTNTSTILKTGAGTLPASLINDTSGGVTTTSNGNKTLQWNNSGVLIVNPSALGRTAALTVGGTSTTTGGLCIFVGALGSQNEVLGIDPNDGSSAPTRMSALSIRTVSGGFLNGAQVAGITNTGVASGLRVTPRQVAMADAAAVTPTSDTADINTFVSTQIAGTLTINAPSGTPTDGQKLTLRLKSTNAQTYSFNATYAFSTSVTAPTTLAAGKTDYIGLMWNATNTKWDVVAVDQGH